MAVRVSCASRAWQQKERMFPKKDQLDTVPGHWVWAVAKDLCLEVCCLPTEALLSWNGGGRHRWSARGVSSEPRNQQDETAKKAPQPQNVCLMRARARVWTPATQRCRMPADNDSAPNRPVTFPLPSPSPTEPEPESKTWTWTTGFWIVSGWEPLGRREALRNSACLCN